jgi:hypothetical protein
MNWLTKLITGYIPNSGKYYTGRPGQTVVVLSSAADVARIEFRENIPFTYFYLRQVSVGGSIIYIYGDEVGPRVLPTEINAVGLVSAGALIGGASVSRCINAIQLDSTNNLHLFTMEPWRTRNLYIGGSAAGTYILNWAYIY